MINRFLLQMFFLVIGMLSLLAGCKDKNSVKDIRDSSSGTYTYQIMQYIFDGTTLTITPGEEDSGTFVLSKTDNGIELREAGIRILEGVNCRAGSGEFFFDIQEQQLGYDGQLIVITGFEGNSIQGEKYHGVYDQPSGEITAYFSSQIRFSTSIRVFELVGVKTQ